MSDRNLLALRRFLDEAAENPDEVWDILDDEIEWEVGDLTIPDFPSSSRGPAEVREFFRRWAGSFDDWGYEVEELVEGGDGVAVRIHQWGRGKGSGATVDQRFWQVWIMREGRAVRVTHHVDESDAFELIGPRV